MKKLSVLLMFTLILGGCSALAALPELAGSEPLPPQQATEQAQRRVQLKEDAAMVQLQDLGPAPELENEIWLNSEQPLRLADLRGKVVLLDMWTFG